MAAYNGVELPDTDALDLVVAVRPDRAAILIGLNLSEPDYPAPGGGSAPPKTTGQIWPRGNW